VAPAPPPPSLDDALAARKAGKPDEYVAILRTLSTSADPQVRRRALALLALQENTVERFEQASDAYPEVAPWLRLKAVDLLRDSGRVPEAIAEANRIVQDAPATSAATLARLRLLAMGEPVPNIPIDELTEKEFVDAAAALDKAGHADLAGQIRMRLLTEYPRGRYTEQTYAAAPIAALSDDAKLALARKLAGYDHYDEALDLLRRMGEQNSREYQSFRLHALFNSRHYDDVVATKNLKDPALMLVRARAAWRADDPKIFLDTLKRIERRHPKSPQAAEAKLLRAKYYTVDEPKLDLAIDNFEKGIKGVGAGQEGENLWTLGWTYILAKKYDDALRIFDRYGKEFPDGDYLSNALFWSGKIHEWQGDVAARNAAFNALLNAYPYSYYSVRAREILGLSPASPLEIPNGNVFPDVEAQLAAANDPRLASVGELTWLGLSREATAEMKSIAAAHPENVGIAFRLADLYASSGEPFKAITMLQRNFRPFIRHGGSGVPHRFWEILFPLKYWESIRTEAQRRQIDPYLIASIIRQESGFEPSVVSNAGAVGIMQIMPQEAERIATAAGIQTPSRQQLFDPNTNIAIGVAEYAQKLAVMRGTEVLAIAAYNAGEDAVGKWLAQAPLDDIDLFVESIPFNETRLYVKSVTRNRFEYRRIYEGVSSSS
jgi:soluble lytic murein transglycosylase-like protein